MVYIEDLELQFILDTFTHSFSRLSSFYQCKHAWYLTYIEGERGENNFFGEYGSFIHKILEKYTKNELSLFELNDYYEENFNDDVPDDAPPNKYTDVRQSYFDKGMEYLNDIDLDFEKYEILGVEKKVEFEISGKHFVGFIDLLVKDKKSGDISIIDHKSASIKILKNGNISKSDLEHFQMFKYQLYLYSIPILQEYGEIHSLQWNMFRDKKWIKIPWNKEEYNNAIQWAKDTLALIEQEKEWQPTQSSFFCNFICNHRYTCEYRPQLASKEEKKEDDSGKYYNPETESYEA